MSDRDLNVGFLEVKTSAEMDRKSKETLETKKLAGKSEGGDRNRPPSLPEVRVIEWMMEIRKYRRSLPVRLVGEMYPEYYKGVHGYEYRIEDRAVKKEVEVKQKVEMGMGWKSDSGRL
ncbi:hypothetical protein [Paenibacillus piri]|uniref:Uncharacterized protein n=1 Tax=Paenibacillus piri TaxID=2547395 RepID=A0A4R5KT93_9BACL|nr:hypothetical protein [Paenibacillus piri]TDF98876.1 hypothetical protein E1757_10195 [Paenibacillus piri]